MESLYTEAGLSSLLARIHSLQADRAGLWGKMNAAQMLAHVRMPLEVPLGKHSLPPSFLMKLLGPSIKKVLMKDQPVKPNQPTAKSMKVTEPKDFQQEKAALIVALNEFVAAGRAGSLPDRHPYFGKMSHDEWDKMQAKHLDHHLSQFGV
ncbi:MAG: DUF1569 domain-containing protein [Bacteroidetes bacterium]|nr:DUF1569 domain-containing protein [Bacteroidota bacterium]